jgi:hypothetical protein
LLGLVGHPGGEEGELRRRADIGVAIDVDDLAGDGAVEGFQRIIVGFEKTPLGLGIVGEGAAGGIAETCRLALVEADVLVGSEIETEIIGIVRCHHPARFGRLRDTAQGEKEEQKDRQTTSRAHCHNTLPTLLTHRPENRNRFSESTMRHFKVLERTLCVRTDARRSNVQTCSSFSPACQHDDAAGSAYQRFPFRPMTDSTSIGQGSRFLAAMQKVVNSKPCPFQTIGLWLLYEQFRSSFQF